MIELLVEAGTCLYDLARDLSEWSQATFGSDSIRGPLGALKHLEKEAKEAQESPDDPEEYADCLLLIFDAARRTGIKPLDLIRHAQAKLEKNKLRLWPMPTSNEPVEHIR